MGAGPGIPSAINITKTSADLVSTGHELMGMTYSTGGFRYSDTLTGGALVSPTQMEWPGWSTSPITMPVSGLVPNTRYYLHTYLTTTQLGEIRSGILSFVTLPSIVNASAKNGSAVGEALVSADFEGGDEALTVTIYYDLNPINPANPSSWVAHSSVVLTPGSDFDYTGFTNFSITGLTPGEVYNLLIVLENETGRDVYPLQLLGGTTLTVSKVVTGDHANKTTKFEFTVYFYEDIDGLIPLSGSFDYYDDDPATGTKLGSLVLDSAGKVSFSLKHGERAVIEGVPADCYVRIVEAPDSFYDASFIDSEVGTSEDGRDTAAGGVGLRQMSEDRVFDFTNERSDVPMVGTDSLAHLPAVLLTLFLLIDVALVCLAIQRRARRRLREVQS